VGYHTFLLTNLDLMK